MGAVANSQAVKDSNRLASPPVSPSCRHTTTAVCGVQVAEHSVPQCPNSDNSTRPIELLLPCNRRMVPSAGAGQGGERGRRVRRA